jgi:hypothetical protein
VELPIRDVVHKRAQLHDVQIGAFGRADGKGVSPHALDVPPIVRAVARQQGANVLGGSIDNLGRGKIALHGWPICRWAFRR